ncbi:hypothetical protein EVAR_87900_1 [Eumeta japonica]|uniref:Uncharacterized protein n=1 Tax=Eumeta variegata TaxID=151549 RepID=A0A4C1WXJ5_EUMVA|nr:hypothetical protein EVAR_87900_1 [Eumeta japonica]
MRRCARSLSAAGVLNQDSFILASVSPRAPNASAHCSKGNTKKNGVLSGIKSLRLQTSVCGGAAVCSRVSVDTSQQFCYKVNV